MNGTASYNGNSLNTYSRATRVGIGVSDGGIEVVSLPDKVTPVYPLADNDGNVASRATYPQKRITINGFISGSSEDNLDSRIDDFKALFNQDGKNLDIYYNGASRRYVAVVEGLPIVRRQKGLFATFTVSFICQPFGSDTSSTSLFSVSNHTSSAYTATPTVGGNAPIQLPIITITLDALTGAADYIQLANDLNGQEMLIYGLGLTAGDVLVIDSSTKVVTLNGDQVEVFGTFLTLAPGASSISYTDGFTTRTVDISATYYKRYL